MKNVLILSFLAVALMVISCNSQSGNRATGPKTFVKGTVVGVGKVKKFNNGMQRYKILVDKDSNGAGDIEFLIEESNPSGVLIHKTQTVTLVIQQGKVTNWYE